MYAGDGEDDDKSEIGFGCGDETAVNGGAWEKYPSPTVSTSVCTCIAISTGRLGLFLD